MTLELSVAGCICSDESTHQTDWRDDEHDTPSPSLR